MMDKKRILLIVIFLSIAYGVLNWFFADTEKASLEQAAGLTVSVIHPKNTAIHEHINVTGTTIARESVEVMSELSGVRILEVLADVGDTVKQDQILARLDAESLGNQLQQIKSDYIRLDDEFKRVDALRNTGVVSEEVLVQKRSAMQTAKAKLDDAELSVQRAIIRAPTDGIIFERNANIGALVSADQPLYRIARNGEIEIEAEIPEAQLSKLKLNQACEILLSGNESPLMGTVRIITPHIESASRTASIRVALDQSLHLPVGLFAHIEINLGDISGSLLPATVLQQDTQGFYVWALDQDNKTIRLPIDIKLRSDEGIVVGDLPEHTRIVARAGAFLKEGERVNVVENP